MTIKKCKIYIQLFLQKNENSIEKSSILPIIGFSNFQFGFDYKIMFDKC